MDHSDPNILVSTDWLSTNLSNPSLRVLDGTWHLPTENRNASNEFQNAHIPNAQFFDIDGISDPNTDLPHMVPSADLFAAEVTKLGISNGDQVVVYDSYGLFSAARVWWLFQAFGFQSIAVLDGGFPKWISEGRSVTKNDNSPTLGSLKADLKPNVIRNASEVKSAIHSSVQIIDARPPARFKGEAPEPRQGLRSGHIPGSKNVFFKSILNADGTLKSDTDIAAVFNNAGVDLGEPIITSCGSGVTASVLSLALAKIGHQKNSLYDGSWSEWGSLYDYPIEQG